MVKEGVLLNAGKVLFCSENSIEVQAAVFAGNDKLTFLDIQVSMGIFLSLSRSPNSIFKSI